MVAHCDTWMTLVRELLDGHRHRVRVEDPICPRWFSPVEWVVVRGAHQLLP